MRVTNERSVDGEWMNFRQAPDCVGQESLGSGQRLSELINEWRTRYDKKDGLTSNSLGPMLGVIVKGLGTVRLEYLAVHPEYIERWLNRMQTERNWSDNTWNRYYEHLHGLFNRAITWKRLQANPLQTINKRVGATRKCDVRIERAIEDRLLAACDVLNRPQHKPNSKRLTWDNVEDIRRRVEAGVKQAAVAAEFGISTGLCCQIVHRKVWNPAKYQTGTKGDEMRRRVYAAFDLGLRTSEMLRVQLKHVDFNPVRVEIDGRKRDVFVVRLPSPSTKGGKKMGAIEKVYVGTDRLKKELTARRVALQNNPEAYVFGTQNGRPVKGFRRLWRELFRVAAVDFGRATGLVWHTTRHEFVFRHAEKTGDLVLTQRFARHRDLRTTRAYFPRVPRVLRATCPAHRSGVGNLCCNEMPIRTGEGGRRSRSGKENGPEDRRGAMHPGNG